MSYAKFGKPGAAKKFTKSGFSLYNVILTPNAVAGSEIYVFRNPQFSGNPLFEVTQQSIEENDIKILVKGGFWRYASGGWSSTAADFEIEIWSRALSGWAESDLIDTAPVTETADCSNPDISVVNAKTGLFTSTQEPVMPDFFVDFGLNNEPASIGDFCTGETFFEMDILAKSKLIDGINNPYSQADINLIGKWE